MQGAQIVQNPSAVRHCRRACNTSVKTRMNLRGAGEAIAVLKKGLTNSRGSQTKNRFMFSIYIFLRMCQHTHSKE